VFCYSIFGLRVASPFVLPDLPQNDGRADVTIFIKKLNPPISSFALHEMKYYRNNSTEIWLAYPRIGHLLISRNSITLGLDFGVNCDLVNTLILGPAFGVVLHLRQRLALHAATVSLGGAAVAIAGASGSGKSTLCAAFCARGHVLLADDITAVERFDSRRWTAFPGPRRINFWRDTGSFLGYRVEELPLIHPGSQKRILRTGIRTRTDAISLKRLYILGRGTRTELTPMSLRASIIELIRHSYSLLLLTSQESSTHFLQCAGLAKDVPARVVLRQPSLTAVPQLVKLIEKDAEEVS
jgi:hypothetical protein